MCCRSSHLNMRKILIILILLILIGLGFYFRNDFLSLYFNLTKKLPAAEKISFDSLVKDIEQKVSTPPPLRVRQEAPQSFLTQSGVIKWTNSQRASSGLPPLTQNSKLDAAALAKAKDMLKNQYFAHISPAGTGPADLAKKAGYEFIFLGENLAIGNFESDQILVGEWMESPGHRENILNSRFREIGVAVVKGIFEGRETWMAVQEFGLPLSVCIFPDSLLKNQIEAYKSQALALEKTINAKRLEFENTQFTSRSQMNQAISEFNDLVNQYNGLVIAVKSLIGAYNAQVNRFNSCVSSQ